MVYLGDEDWLSCLHPLLHVYIPFFVVLFRRVLRTVTMFIVSFSDGQEAPFRSLSSAAGCLLSSLECASVNGLFMAGSSVKSSSLRCSQKTDKAHGWSCSSPRCSRCSALVLHTTVFLCLKVILGCESTCSWWRKNYLLQRSKSQFGAFNLPLPAASW